ncbi:hypothetical protein ACIRBX_12700 [Kitasatospora sp. NPDC096147]|uniref:hypothetical protein n=1 Tax=Kitasatospora sp. NPDC096147 TaxID=3364093 RepID=UPI00382AC256
MAAFMAFFDGSTTAWRIDVGALSAGIAELWGELEVDPARRGEVCAFRWSCRSGERPAEVLMAEDGTGLYLDAPLSEAVRVACLLRRFVPEAVELVFCDEGYCFDVRVRPEASAAELMAEVEVQC